MNKIFEWWWNNMLYFRAEDNVLAAGFLLIIPMTIILVLGILIIKLWVKYRGCPKDLN